MSKKGELLNLLETYKGKYEEVQNKINTISENKDGTYSQEGISRTVEDMTNKFSPVASQYHDKAISIINDGVKILEDKWRANSTGKLMDSGYQIGLMNVIKMIETGSISNREDFQNIIDVYKNDYNAIATIKNVMKESSINLEILALIPIDNREYNKKLINDLRNNIDININSNTLKSSDLYLSLYDTSSSVSLSLSSMSEFIRNRLGENLELIG